MKRNFLLMTGLVILVGIIFLATRSYGKVTLSEDDYTNIIVVNGNDYSYTQDEINNYIDTSLLNYKVYEERGPEDIIERGDMVYISYKILSDGEVADDGYCQIEAGGVKPCKEVADAVIGKKSNDTLTVIINETLSYQVSIEGAETVEIKKHDTMDEDFVKNYLRFDTISQAKDFFEEEYKSSIESRKLRDNEELLCEKIISSGAVELKNNAVNRVLKNEVKIMKTVAKSKGMKIDDFLSENKGCFSADEYMTKNYDTAEIIIKETLIYNAIAKELGLDVSAEAIKKNDEGLAKTGGFENLDEYYAYGEGKYMSEYNYKKNTVLNKIKETVTFEYK